MVRKEKLESDLLEFGLEVCGVMHRRCFQQRVNSVQHKVSSMKSGHEIIEGGHNTIIEGF